MRPFLRPAVLLSALALMFTPLAAQAQSEGDARVIVISGEGTISAPPDLASLRVGVSTQAATAAAALSENSERMAGLMALIAERGIEARDVQTTDFSVQPVYQHLQDGRPPRLSGYQVRNIVHLRLRDLSVLGNILDALVGEGSNTLSGLSFGLADPETAQREAEAAAVADALERAEAMAAAAGLRLGPVLRIDASNGSARPRPMMEMAARAADSMDVPVAAGELSVSAQVRVTVELQD
jgi:uncharacterized protein YggE